MKIEMIGKRFGEWLALRENSRSKSYRWCGVAKRKNGEYYRPNKGCHAVLKYGKS